MSKPELRARASIFACGCALALAVGAVSTSASQWSAQEQAAIRSGAASEGSTGEHYSPPVREPAENNLYWGDTHLHTKLSADAFDTGTHTMTPVDAYRFARGEALVSETGLKVKLRRPLDFLAVADHAEYLGGFALAVEGDPEMLSTPLGQQWAEIAAKGQSGDLLRSIIGRFQKIDPERPTIPRPLRLRIWRGVAETADRFYVPGSFSTFSAYEWSSGAGGENLHRVVMFKDGADKVTQMLPFSAADSLDPEELWEALAAYENGTGGEVLAIPHNGNLSNGRMFEPTTYSRGPMTAGYARMRSRWEPVYEVTQTKGDGETHPTLAPTDEFANFERWDDGNLSMSQGKQPWMLPYEYARSALKEGLRHESRLGVNPFKFGMIGSTDSHNGLSTTAENNFFGKFAHDEPSSTRSKREADVVGRQTWQLGAAGLAAVWAPENTREAIFAAFKRREVYGTTGSRIQLRFFGGWNYRPDEVRRADYATIGYKKGVPMGGDLMRSSSGKAPVFMVVAAKDPDGANLDRIQIVKGWLDAAGQTREKVYDVALSDNRKVNRRTGKAPPVGSTVDVKNATYTNSIGDPELATVWTDPDFDPSQRAFYYVRVLEIPKPRWTAYDAKFYKLNLPQHIPMTVQDRAYSSPIWYKP